MRGEECVGGLITKYTCVLGHQISLDFDQQLVGQQNSFGDPSKTLDLGKQ